jgi:putative ABC transport system substrate-binding protein
MWTLHTCKYYPSTKGTLLQVHGMRRRAFIAGLASAAAWPSTVRAQQDNIAVIGVLVLGSPDPRLFLRALREGLTELGYVDGQNIRLVIRSAAGIARELPNLANELVRLKPNVLIAFQTPALLAVSKATSEIPIVMGTGDPDVTGRVASFARPGSNITGVIQGNLETAGKILELIRELLPSAMHVAVLANKTDPFTKPFLVRIESAAKVPGFSIQSYMIDPDQELEAIFDRMSRDKSDALVVQPSVLNKTGVELALRHGLPTFAPTRQLPTMGGLASYAAKVFDVYRGTASYVDKILKGSNPGDLPIAFPAKFELVINLKTAKALGVPVTPMMLGRADEVIE